MIVTTRFSDLFYDPISDSWGEYSKTSTVKNMKFKTFEIVSTALFVLLAFLVSLLVACSTAFAGDLWMSVHIKRVVDGDTFVLTSGVGDKCRMKGYNAPEKDEDPELYEAAKQKLVEIFKRGGNKVYIFTKKRDRWNRLVCQVYLDDGTDVNAEMRAWLEDQGYEGVGKYDKKGGAK